MPEFPIPSARILLVSQIQGGGATAPLPLCPVRLCGISLKYVACSVISSVACLKRLMTTWQLGSSCRLRRKKWKCCSGEKNVWNVIEITLRQLISAEP